MKRITLKKMSLKNFKGVRSLEVDFGRDTSVYGCNGTGKTTLYDAFTWVLFDKDGRDSGKFVVATNDENGNVIPRIEHEVSLTLDVDGTEVRLTKSVADKWVTQRGTTTPKLAKWETTYKVNDVPHRERDYNAYITELCGYNTFKLVTMTGYFMSLPESERRTMLLNMAGGDINPDDVAATDKSLEAIVKALQNETYDKFNERMAAEKKRYKKERDTLEVEINNESNKIRHDLPTLEEVEDKIRETEQRIVDIDSQISDRTSSLKSAQEANRKRQDEILKADQELNRLIGQKIAAAQKRKNTLESDIRGVELAIQGLQNTISYLKAQNEQQLAIYEEKTKIREQFAEQLKLANAETFRISNDDVCCPTCGRMFEGDMLNERSEELRKKFYERKAQRLTDIQTKGKANSILRNQAQQQSASYLKQIAEIKQQIADARTKAEMWAKELETFEIPTEEYLAKVDTDVIAAANKRDNLMRSAESELPSVDVSDLQNTQKALRLSLGELNQQLAEVKRNENDKESLMAKDERYTEISAKIAEIELMEDQMMQYSRKRAMMLEQKVNRMFAMVNFKFLAEQLNGGIKEICEAYYKGSPYSTNLNNGARINADIDICTAIANFYGIQAPIFVDNAEASNSFIATDAQLVKLIVSEDKELRISTNN